MPFPLLTIRSIVIVLAVAGVAGAAYFSERSTSGDTFAVGEVDITIDNESYYNGAANLDTSWELTDLTIEKFFNFTDVKPGDYGEDTISLHVSENDSYLCADVTLTSNDENGCVGPEAAVDDSCGDPGAGDGELAGLMEFMWWADDGDNVFESDETVISQGPLGALTLDEPRTVTLADSAENIWTNEGEPVEEGETRFIGKAWCFGGLVPAPLPQDGETDEWSPADDTDGNGTPGEPADGGFTCEGLPLGNESQTDSLTLDVAFNAVQTLGNEAYECSDGVPPEPGGEPGELFYDGFGNGPTDDSFDEDPVWIEGGSAGAEKSGPAGAEESSSPDGNRFARMRGGDGVICKELDATGFTDLELEYYWRGDDEGAPGDEGLLQVAGGTCASPTGVTTLEAHDMSDSANPPWHLHTEDMSVVNNSTFLLIFRADTSGGGVDFRIDGVTLSGVPI